jgi:DNA adenine methylase
MFDRVKRAWAVLMLANGSYGCTLDGGFGYDHRRYQQKARQHLLKTIPGKFILSSFHNKTLSEFIKRNRWHSPEFRMACTMTHGYKTKRKKFEVMTANFPN